MAASVRLVRIAILDALSVFAVIVLASATRPSASLMVFAGLEATLATLFFIDRPIF